MKLSLPSLVAAVFVASTPLSALAAYPTDTYSVAVSGVGASSGGVIWYNRSVGFQGSVRDYSGGSASTQALFLSHAGSYAGPSATRTVSNGATLSYNFTLDGSSYSGGITRVMPAVCDLVAQCVGPSGGYLYRP